MAKYIIVLMCSLLLSACATVPSGPSVMALPGTGKSFEQFQTDDVVCRDWASREAGTTPQRTAGLDTAEGAGIGTRFLDCQPQDGAGSLGEARHSARALVDVAGRPLHCLADGGDALHRRFEGAPLDVGCEREDERGDAPHQGLDEREALARFQERAWQS